MDFSSRRPMAPSTNRFTSPDIKPNSSQHDHPSHGEPLPHMSSKGLKPEPPRHGLKHKTGWVQSVMVFFLLCLVVLVAALLLTIALGNQNEAKFVDLNSTQAVAVTSGATTPTYYFGRISTISNDYIVLDSAYVATTSPASNLTVEPLVCNKSVGSSQIILNRGNVLSWNNLASNSAALKAIESYKSENPSGQCPPAQQAAVPDQNSGSSTPTSNPTTSTNPSNSGQASGSTTSGASTSTSPSSSEATTSQKP